MNKLAHTLFFAALGATLAGCGSPQEPAEAPRPALVIEVKADPDANRVVYSGEVRARHEADLAFRIAGKLTARQVEVGSLVKAGDVLARIDPADSALNAEAARSQLAASSTEYTYASAELDRYRTLLEKKFISQAVYDSKLNAFKAAQAKHNQAQAQAALAGNQAGYAVLRADQAGVITAVNADPGQVVAAGQAVMKLARLDEKEVVIAVPESRLAELRAAQDASVRLWAAPEKIYRGRIREIAPTADTATRTFAVKVSMLDADPKVRLGMTANVLLGGAATPSLLLPLSALTQQDGKPSVWVLEGADNKVVARAVQIGAYHENGVSVLSGLKPGERIVAAGVHKLLPGQIVRPLTYTAWTPQP
ncbi:MAG: efflux RND transporter periplasmic adaptor subunit [Betaproteobacteria bacterium]|nr:efflux RND transporter periplasmic adaptor subunit [Betaproteobacteria bacterium]